MVMLLAVVKATLGLPVYTHSKAGEGTVCAVDILRRQGRQQGCPNISPPSKLLRQIRKRTLILSFQIFIYDY